VTRCSEYARSLGEPLAGTAAYARAWVALEQPGPWGPKALVGSHLDQALGLALTERSAEVALKVVLVRRIGHHADDHLAERPRNAWVAYVGPGEPWLEHRVVEDPKALLDLDFAAIADGQRPSFGAPQTSPLLLVCTNSKRDTCCALLGRPVAAELAETMPDGVWESSHLGGHRLAPNVLSLPDGFMYGGPGAAGLTLAACRGRSALSRPGQAAELAALELAGAPRPYALTVEPSGESWLVSDPGSAAAPRLVRVSERVLEPPRPESCSKAPVSLLSYVAEPVVA
jgi:hypothetical protein